MTEKKPRNGSRFYSPTFILAIKHFIPKPSTDIVTVTETEVDSTPLHLYLL